MQINREFWDGETYDFTARNESSTLLAQIVNTTMENKIVADFSKYSGEWDKSVSPWKINHNSALFSKAWALTWNDGTNLNTKFSRFFKERKKGYTFYLATQGLSNNADYDGNCYYPYMYTPNYYSTLTNPDIDLENSTYTAALHNKFGYIKPVIKFNYGRLFVIPVIHYKFGNSDYARVLQTTDEANFDASHVTGFSFGFYYLDRYGSLREFPIGLYALNDTIIPPYWSEWNTNCWKDEEIDNGCMLLSYRYRRNEQYMVSDDIGNSIQFSSENGTTYYSNTTATESAAATLNYFPAKQIPTFTNALPDRESDIFDDNWTSYYVGGSSYWYNSIYRNCKSTVTFSEFVDYIKLQAAYIGFRFCPFYDKATQGIDSEWFYIPEINDAGVTTGNYYQANSTEAEQLNNYSWTDNVYEVTPYDGTDDEEDIDPNEYDESLTTSLALSPFRPSIGTNDYLMTEDALKEITKVFCYWKYAEEEEVVPAGSCAKLFGSDDPFDCINNIIKYPYDLATDFTHNGNTAAGIKGVNPDATHGLLIGNTEIVVDPSDPSGTGQYQGETVFCSYNEILRINYYTSIPIYTINPLNYFALYNSFLDYAPYSSAELYVPFCGSVQIDPKTFIGNNVIVQLIVSPSEGTVRADICRGALLLQSMTGTIGTSINLTSQDIGQRTNAVQQANATIEAQKERMARNVAGFALAAGAAALTGGSAIPAAMTGLGVLNQAAETKVTNEMSQYTIDTAEAPFHKAVTGNGFLTQISQASADLVIHRPKMLANYDAQAYAHTTGFATLDNTQISNYHGYTVVDAIDLSGVQCTEKEAQMIKSALKQGVYLP